MNTEQLADALRTIDEHCQTGLNSSVYSHWSAALEDAMRVSREAIAAYDAQQVATPSDGLRWHVDEGGDGEIELWRDDWASKDGRSGGGPIEPIATVYDIEDARRIVQCVNAHDTLVSALRTILADKGSASFNDDLEAYDAAIQTASDALAQAGVTP